MSVSPAAHRQALDAGHTDKTQSDKNKHIPGHTGTKNETHKTVETHGHTNTLRKSNFVEHTSVHNKSDAKKHTSIDTHVKTAHAAGGAHTNETMKSHGTTVTHGTHPHIKVQIHTDTHGKAPAPSRSDTHGKTGTHGTAKKSAVHKPRTKKHNKTEHDKSDPEKDDHTVETDNAVTTAVSQNSENISNEKSNNDD